MPRLTRSLLAALAALFITVPVATASPDRGPVQTSSLAGTVSQPAAGDLRTADARDAATAPATPGSVEQRRPSTPTVVAAGRLNPVPVAHADDSSPYVALGAIALAGLLLAGSMGYAMRESSRARFGV